MHKGKWTKRKWLGFVLPLMAAEWIVFKLLYPYADYFIDSYGYIQAAVQRDAIGFRPIGYSLFLRLVHGVAASDLLVVTLQYAIVQGASLGLVLWLRRWCGLGERTVGVLMAFLLLNPLVPYVCNYISSDALFIGLSLLWLTMLMGMLRDPRWWRLALQVALLFVIFNLRYVALFYPAVAALTVLLARRGWWFGIVGVGASVGVILAGTIWIKSITKRETGADLFSSFSGWQLANNALNVYSHIPVDTAGLLSPECRELAGYVKAYFEGQRPAALEDTTAPDVGSAETRKAPSVTTAYMWLRASPLHQYLYVYKQRGRLDYFDAWNRVGVVFTRYGTFVARKHPLAWLQYYSWPSAKTFFWSSLDIFTLYNEGKPDVDKLAMDWFHYPGTKMRVYSATMQGRLLAPMTGIYLVLNIAFVGAGLWFLPFASLRGREPVFTGSFRLASAFLLANAFFSIFAAPSVLRYQVLPMIVLFIFTVCAISKSRLFSVN
jgi:hypothetical protein